MSVQIAVILNGSTRPRSMGYLTAIAQDALASFRAGAEIYGQGEAAGALYSIEAGCVRIGRLSPNGRRQICGFCFPGDVFGWENGPEHWFFAEAVEKARVRILRPHRDIDAPTKLLPLALKTLIRFQQHLLVLGSTSVDERLAAFICDLVERQGGGRAVKLPMCRSDIGDYLGVSLETVSRVLRRFRDQGLIDVPDTHSLIVLDQEALEEYCSR